jgi:dihydroflavonol-4-reductase
MTTVITGASGQVGSHLLDELLRRGRRVRALVLPGDESLAGRDVEIVHGDVRDLDSLRRAFEGAEAVFHLAAVISTASDPGPLLFPVNVGGARNAAQAAREAGAGRFVHFSSMVVFDPAPLDRPLDETRARLGAACSPYTRSKLLGEAAVRAEVARGLDAVVVHPTVIVGPRETHHTGIVRGLIAKHFTGELPALVEGSFDLVDVLDVVEGALLAEARGRAGESYILGGGHYSVAELLALAQASCGRRPPLMRVPLALARGFLPLMELGARALGTAAPYNAEDLVQLAGNRDIRSDKAKRELGYAPRPIEDAVRRVHAWLEAEAAASRRA